MKKLFLILALLPISLNLNAQFAEFYSSIPSTNIVINDAVTAMDNSIYACGQNTDNQSALLIHINAAGNLLWWVEYPNISHFQRMVVATDNSNDVLLMTNTRPASGGVSSDFRWTVCRINPAGTVLWMNDYDCNNGGTNDVERGYFISTAIPVINEYFIGGSFNTSANVATGVGLDDLMVLRIDGSVGGAGAVLATARYDDNDDEYRTGTENGNGGCVIIGDKTQGSINGCLAELNNNLSMANNFTYNTNNTIIWDVDRENNDYVLLGALGGGANGDMYVMQTTSAGVIGWQVRLGINAVFASSRVSIVADLIYVTFVDPGGVSHVHILDQVNGTSVSSFIDPASNGAGLVIPQTNGIDLYYINRSLTGNELYVVDAINELCDTDPYPSNYPDPGIGITTESYTPDTPDYDITVLGDAPLASHTSVRGCPNHQLCKYICNQNNDDYGRSIITTQDNEVALLGTMLDADPSAECDMYFAKLDNNLNYISPGIAKKIGDLTAATEAFEDGYSIMQASDGFYYLVGTSLQKCGTRDVYIVKLNPVGYGIMWAKNYGLPSHDEYGIKVVESTNPTDAALIVVGYRQKISLSNNQPHKIFAFRINPNGAYDGIIDTHIYSGGPTANNNDFAWDAIALDKTNEIVIVGETNNLTDQSLLAFRIRQDNLAMADPSSFYIIDDGTCVDEAGYGVVEYDENIYITGKTNTSGGNGAMDALIVKLPSNFTTAALSETNIYGRISDNYADECGYSIIKTSDNNLVVAGYKWMYNPQDQSTLKDGLVFKVNTSNGLNLMWSQHMGSSPNVYRYNDVLYDLVQLPDGLLALTGYKGLTNDDSELFLSKLNDGGDNSCCFRDYPMNKEKGSKQGKYFNEIQPVGFKDGGYKFFELHDCEVKLCEENASFRITDKTEKGSLENSPVKYSENNGIRLYPNPNNGSFNLTVTKPGEYIKSYDILDLSGRLVHSKDFSDQSENSAKEITLPGFTPGIYFIEVKTNSDRIRTKLVIE